MLVFYCFFVKLASPKLKVGLLSEISSKKTFRVNYYIVPKIKINFVFPLGLHYLCTSEPL